MYTEFYGLRELPFELTSNPKYLYLPPRHREALSNLQYGLAAAKTVTLLIGEAGTGKTVLLKAALASARCCQVRCVYLNNPALTRGEFIELFARSMGLSAEAARSKGVLLAELEGALRQRQSRGEVTALIIDEAQSLSADLLEEIRLLANMETEDAKLLPLVLAGQPDLGLRLENPDWRSLKQRVVLRCETTALDLHETVAYIATRIRSAGGVATRLFTREAVTLIYENSGGIPRTISVICDNALVHGLAMNRQPVRQDIVREVCRDFNFGERLAALPGAARKRGAIGANPPLQADRPASQGEHGARDEGEESDRIAPQRKFSLFAARRW
jgi:general secretion pathway protein A